jgi:hypothetical protein
MTFLSLKTNRYSDGYIIHYLRRGRHRLREAHAWVVGKLTGRPPERIVWWSDDDREFDFMSDMGSDDER